MDFNIEWNGTAHPELEDAIRAFCEDHAHPREMYFLHYPLDNDHFVDCVWSEVDEVLICEYVDDPNDSRRMKIDAPDDADLGEALASNDELMAILEGRAATKQ